MFSRSIASCCFVHLTRLIGISKDLLRVSVVANVDLAKAGHDVLRLIRTDKVVFWLHF